MFKFALFPQTTPQTRGRNSKSISFCSQNFLISVFGDWIRCIDSQRLSCLRWPSFRCSKFCRIVRTQRITVRRNTTHFENSMIRPTSIPRLRKMNRWRLELRLVRTMRPANHLCHPWICLQSNLLIGKFRSLKHNLFFIFQCFLRLPKCFRTILTGHSRQVSNYPDWRCKLFSGSSQSFDCSGKFDNFSIH